MFPGIGIAKCHTLINAGIHAAKQLIECEGGHPSIKNSWKRIVTQCFDGLRNDVVNLRSRVESLNEEAMLEVMIEPSVADEAPNEGAPNESATEDETEGEVPQLPFSTLNDPLRHDCLAISKGAINRIHMDDFHKRNPIQLAKMRSTKSKC